MIELPEACTITYDLRQTILNKTIVAVGGNYTDHKFTFYEGDPNHYHDILQGKKVTAIIDRYFYIEIQIEDYTLLFRDGSNLRYLTNTPPPKKSKLLLSFADHSYLNMTTSMYASIAVFKTNKGLDNAYYQIECNSIGPLDSRFSLSYFHSLINEKTLKLSTKAFLATEQRILGVGNGTVQDILFNTQLHPKRKMNTLSTKEIETLYHSIIDTLNKMIEQRGRETEKDIYGQPGQYHSILSKNTYKLPCPICQHSLIKEQYLGGSIYYCPQCQK